jgi:hypothetical protein
MTRIITGKSPWPASRTAEVPYDSPAPRQLVPYRCGKGHEFTVTFAAEAEPPAAWDCRCGAAAAPATAAAEIPASAPVCRRRPTRPEQEHGLALVLERRTVAELEALLAERVAEVRASRTEG